jgi:hypothetical protein
MDEARNTAMQFALDLARTQVLSADDVVAAAAKLHAFLAPRAAPSPLPQTYDLGKGDQTPALGGPFDFEDVKTRLVSRPS